MASIKFTRADVVRLLRLPNSEAVEDLIRAKVLDVSAYTYRGKPLFDVETVRRAATRVLVEREP
jgi:hypothetical protein